MEIKGPGHFLSLIKAELARNKRLGYFLGFINTMGLCLGLLPFVMLYAKQMYHTQSQDTGLFLLTKVIGSVTIGFILFLLNKRYKYRYLLYANSLLMMVLLVVLLLSTSMPPFILIFLAGGIVISIYSISMNGVMLEISSTENRTLYAGIAGAGNIIPAVFPLLGGWIIVRTGYPIFFALFMFFILISLFFIYKLDCSK
jgi:MFS family permease